MDQKMQQEIALHRWAVIAEAAKTRLTSPGARRVVRADRRARSMRTRTGRCGAYSRGTIDR